MRRQRVAARIVLAVGSQERRERTEFAQQNPTIRTNPCDWKGLLNHAQQVEQSNPRLSRYMKALAARRLGGQITQAIYENRGMFNYYTAKHEPATKRVVKKMQNEDRQKAMQGQEDPKKRDDWWKTGGEPEYNIHDTNYNEIEPYRPHPDIVKDRREWDRSTRQERQNPAIRLLTRLEQEAQRLSSNKRPTDHQIWPALKLLRMVTNELKKPNTSGNIDDEDARAHLVQEFEQILNSSKECDPGDSTERESWSDTRGPAYNPAPRGPTIFADDDDPRQIEHIHNYLREYEDWVRKYPEALDEHPEAQKTYDYFNRQYPRGRGY